MTQRRVAQAPSVIGRLGRLLLPLIGHTPRHSVVPLHPDRCRCFHPLRLCPFRPHHPWNMERLNHLFICNEVTPLNIRATSSLL